MKILRILLIILFISNLSFADEWHVKKDAENLIKFSSSTMLLDFDGTTDKIDGYIYWDGKEIFSGINELYFEVELNSVKTGIGKRDRDMREDVLETDKWPTTYFKGRITDFKGENGSYKVKVKGKMFIHGVEKELTIPGDIYLKGDQMNIKTNFSVFLKDYKIKAPSLLAFIKVAEEIKLHLDFNLNKYTEKVN